MSERYQVPKNEVPAHVVLADGTEGELHLYVSERAERHTGRERPSDILNDEAPFFPVRFSDTGFALVRRSSVLVMTVRLEDELVAGGSEGAGLLQTGPAVEDAERHEIRLVLEEGTVVEGSVTYVMPPGERRLQDFLNQTPRFVTVRTDGSARLVNSDRIVRVEPV